VQSLPSSHAYVLTHDPDTQVSDVHWLPSLHVFASFAVWLHCPLAGSHASSVQVFPSSQETEGAPRHAPAWHKSGAVQALPSSHGVASGAGSSRHCPVAASQVATWQGALVEQETGSLPRQTPPWQASVRVQALVSSHGVPSGRLVYRHAPDAGSQVPGPWQVRPTA
jgi:hypothetical protein